MSGGFYLYGVISAESAAGLGSGASGEPLRSIESGGPLGLAVVAGESEGPPLRPELAALTVGELEQDGDAYRRGQGAEQLGRLGNTRGRRHA